MDGLHDGAAAPPPPQQKRDEWSEGGISRLLEAYEAKWLLRNRAKLKWSDWVDIANDVSAHCSSTSSEAAGKPGGGSAKTPNQCKNKVESMKKRYRAESAAAARAGSGAAGTGTASASATSWRFFGRMDGLLKGPAAATSCSGQLHTEPTTSISAVHAAKAEPEIDAHAEADVATLRQPPPPDAGLAAGTFSDLLNADANGSASAAEKVEQVIQKQSSRAADSDGANLSSPRSKEEANGVGADEACDDDALPSSRKRKGSGSELDVARSIELLASSFVKIERARMEMYRETERMRAEAEVKKGEMELKRTEIMAKTQLQIARLFAKRLREFSGNGRNGGSSSEVDGIAKKGENEFDQIRGGPRLR
ncbi:uncharacterized protein [Lolium perenne]|uniref:uncharacterized protein isoform X2 n=1 Tax=Lolium perenne TaxID=4522 RepID=UPI0021F63BB3|nr:trihelix transcription factor ENAP1 isoform X2 [Lolium perenne]